MLVLASASPRRQEILRNAGIPFSVEVTNVLEQPLPGERPQEMVERLAREKATVAAGRHRYAEAWVLGADTTVVVDQHILEKPCDAQDAARMLRLLSGKTHQVITGVCLIGPQAKDPTTASETTLVYMNELTEA